MPRSTAHNRPTASPRSSRGPPLQVRPSTHCDHPREEPSSCPVFERMSVSTCSPPAASAAGVQRRCHRDNAQAQDTVDSRAHQRKFGLIDVGDPPLIGLESKPRGGGGDGISGEDVLPGMRTLQLRYAGSEVIDVNVKGRRWHGACPRSWMQTRRSSYLSLRRTVA
ncbi:hypothetical protein LXA43DRAFT_244715, partial [Ganoderma leucocontextum]